ncbi:MAG TPA: hypothetical protein VJQ56_08725 [Blastocatellia bacterium]|nr:hypothetical protein [Blastocatellia bacterium]
MVYVIAVILGLFIAFILWFVMARWIAASIVWVESRYPHLLGSRGMRVSEAVACGLLVIACFAIAFWIAQLLVR